MLYTGHNTVVYVSVDANLRYLASEPAKKPLAIQVGDVVVMSSDELSVVQASWLFYEHSKRGEYVVDGEQIADMISRFGGTNEPTD